MTDLLVVPKRINCRYRSAEQSGSVKCDGEFGNVRQKDGKDAAFLQAPLSEPFGCAKDFVFEFGISDRAPCKRVDQGRSLAMLIGVFQNERREFDIRNGDAGKGA